MAIETVSTRCHPFMVRVKVESKIGRTLIVLIFQPEIAGCKHKGLIVARQKSHFAGK